MHPWRRHPWTALRRRGPVGRHRAPRVLAGGLVAVATLAGLTAAAGLTGLVGLPVPADAATTATPPAATAGGAVTLATGDTVGVSGSATGRPVFTLRPGTSHGGQSYQDASGDTYLVPALAAPYLGRQLDLSLFDVSALARDGLTGAARVPVSLTFAAGSTPTAPAGVTLTAVDGTSATGSVTDPAALGAALKHAIGADVAAGRRPGSTPPVPGLTRLGLAAPGAPAVARPNYPLHPLEIDGVDLTGAPGTFTVSLMNTDVALRQLGVVPVVDGVARVQVPAGHYAAQGGVEEFDAQGNTIALRVVTLNDFTVPDAGTTAVTVDLRDATSAVSVTGTPRPAVQDNAQANYYRTDAAGTVVRFGGATTFDQVPIYLNAQPAATTGTLHLLVQWGGTATIPADRYRYDVAFASDDGVAANQSYPVRAGQLATVHDHFSTDPGHAGTGMGLLMGATDAAVLSAGGQQTGGGGVTVPGELTQYLGTADGGQWASSYGGAALGLRSNVRAFAAGRAYDVDWGRGPLAAGLGRYNGWQRICLACVTGGTVTLGLPELHDSAGDTSDYSTEAPEHVTLYRDGALIADQDNVIATVRGLPTGAATFREVADVTLGGSFTQSTSTHTDVTVHYPGSGSALPSSDVCVYGLTTTEPCQILPVPTLTYHLAADPTNTSRAATQTMGLDVGHVSYDGAGSSSPVTAATVSVSFDGGTTWTAAGLTGTAGHYLARWTNPASARGTSPTLKVTATDADGNAITQTITAAYTIAAAS